MTSACHTVASCSTTFTSTSITNAAEKPVFTARHQAVASESNLACRPTASRVSAPRMNGTSCDKALRRDLRRVAGLGDDRVDARLAAGVIVEPAADLAIFGAVHLLVTASRHA